MCVANNFAEREILIGDVSDDSWELAEPAITREHSVPAERARAFQTAVALRDIIGAFGKYRDDKFPIGGRFTYYRWDGFCVLDIGDCRVIYCLQ